ncbi:hypothetical protein QYE76_022142 [Lolium multiflorum]|uniref:Transposase (putative) gypsy type domain-containing protein n=1 Tax=Lolium multiflorum TaxID=4521 RepID=A0AAD8VTI2_LOLMU|nr:hypothetical protein QYE76_022142 [Lolium multiflorum]
MHMATFTFSLPSPLRLLPRASAARQISLPANSSPESFKRRSSKVSLDLSCSRLTGKSSPPPIRGLTGDLRVESGRFFLAGVTGNLHAIAGEKGQWWPSEFTDSELKAFAKEGLIAPDTWSFQKDSSSPNPEPDERVFTKAWVERGLSLPTFEFFLSVLNTYGLQPHNLCPNSFLLLSNFVTLCEGHLGIHPDIRLWQFFYRVKKETKEKFYVKNVLVLGVHDSLPAFVNNPPEGLASWSLIPALAQYPKLDKAARRISWLVHDGLTGMDLTLSWFTRWIQPLKYNKRLICEYSGEVPEINKDISVNNKCPSLNSLADDGFRNIFRVPASAGRVEEDPEDGDEGDEQAPKKAVPRVIKRLRAKVSGTDAGTSGEASAKKAKTKPPPRLDSKKAERDRIKLLATTGKGSRSLLSGAT